MTDFTEMIPKPKQYNSTSFSINFLDFETIHFTVGIHWSLYKDPN